MPGFRAEMWGGECLTQLPDVSPEILSTGSPTELLQRWASFPLFYRTEWRLRGEEMCPGSPSMEAQSRIYLHVAPLS